MSGRARPGLLRQAIAMFGNPRAVLSRHTGRLGLFATLTVPLLAFALFFLQSGLDLQRVGTLDASGVAALTGSGALLGIALVPLLALVAWIIVLPFERSRSLGWTIRAFSLAYAPALVYGACGLAASLALGWNTAVAFGITGVLWATAPLFAALREMSGDRRRLSLVLASLVGAAVLFIWSVAVGG